MAPRPRCTECRRTFAPSPRAVTTQRVCGRACRAARDRKLARARRARDIEGYRADERRRQEESRGSRARAKRPPVEAAETVETAQAPAPAARHAPPSVSKPPDLQKKIAQSVARAIALSRASLERDLRRIWPREREIVARPGAVSRASFGGQSCDPKGESGAIPADCHA
jgi:hypothetical protein